MFLGFKFKIKVVFVVVFIAAFRPFSAIAQDDKKEQSLMRKANIKFLFAEYNKALPLYLKLLEHDTTNFLYNFRAGVCYLKSNVEIAKSVQYFERALKYKAPSNGATFEFYFNIGNAYHITNRFDDAIEAYTIAKTFHNPDYYPVTDSLVNNEITECEIGRKLMQVPTEAKIFNLGKNVNSIYPDYSPVILPDQSTIIFTSTRKGSTGGKRTVEGGDFFEDVYISKKISVPSATSTTADNPINSEQSLFSAAENLSVINTKGNDASMAVSPDGKWLFVFSKNKIWQLANNNGKFEKPISFKSSVFLKTDIGTSLFFTNDGSTLYIVSSRPGGYGGKDIYKSLKQKDGSWGTAENLGPIINTSSDEESPFFDAEEQTLYFSSQGHNSMGGFDVFKSKLENNGWSKPENMGCPINSGIDDIFYTYNKKENVGFYTTMREDGIGNYDIYMLKYIQSLKASLLATYSGNLTPKNLKIIILGLEGKDSIKKLKSILKMKLFIEAIEITHF